MSPQVTSGYCKNRVWDNGDMGSCGKKTLPGNRYCTACRVDKLNGSAQDVRRLELELKGARFIYDELLAEGQPK